MKNLKKTPVLFVALGALFFLQVAVEADFEVDNTDVADPIVSQNTVAVEADIEVEADAQVQEADSSATIKAADSSTVKRTNEVAAKMVMQAYGVENVKDLKAKLIAVGEQISKLKTAAVAVETAAAKVRTVRESTGENNTLGKYADASSGFLTLANEMSTNTCAPIAEKAVSCCRSPDSCQGRVLSTVRKAAPWVGLVGMLAAAYNGGGGMAQCLGSLPSIVEGLSQSAGISRACTVLNKGGDVKTSAGTMKVKGVTQVCGEIREIVSKTFVAGASHSTKVSLVSELEALEKNVSNSLARDAGQAKKQAKGIKTAYRGTKDCIQAFKNGEEDVAVAAALILDCGEENGGKELSGGEAAAAKLSTCPGYSASGLGSNGVSTKTSGLDVSTGKAGAPSPDEVEVDLDGRPVLTGVPLGSVAQAKTTQPRLSGPGGSSPTASQKAKRGSKRSPRSSKNLISGYRTSKTGGPGSSRRPAFSRFKNPFKLKSKQKKSDKTALAALSKLMKAGISPDQSGSIFERISNRLSATAAQENLLDYKRNKKLWMEN